MHAPHRPCLSKQLHTGHTGAKPCLMHKVPISTWPGATGATPGVAKASRLKALSMKSVRPCWLATRIRLALEMIRILRLVSWPAGTTGGH